MRRWRKTIICFSQNWRQSLQGQGEVLARLIEKQLRSGPLKILDCACGIGTQAIGLAIQGHELTASDQSPAAVKRAAREAKKLGLSLNTIVADFRTLPNELSGSFDVVLACDNAIPHLQNENEIIDAAVGMMAALSPGGLLLISTRDYDHILSVRPSSTPPRLIESDEGRRIVFQLWEWDDSEESYSLELFILNFELGRWQTRSYRTRYRAWRRKHLADLFSKAGLADVRWEHPDTTGYYQPILTARKTESLKS